ncbi:formyltetrahydrofolate deformylase [Helicobacter sp. MIT 14-3879]|uniref:formyltetrahydrofolate deformylase n=1 Tax=Helicobacter sp. MIT 14-3879 TaxID=2040649 RepID=UPI000E1EC366|nr:formyltetrahydrofolate deformylase [Helicobacter sp. MIT 14-3879]RDU63127.1 formyltetrahydrofolate deformylase [Helicobacter sp. MIT 14-3879]
MNFIILISIPDRSGLIHKVSSTLLNYNIEKNDEFVDKENSHFFMRTKIKADEYTTKEEIKSKLKNILPKESFIKIVKEEKKSIIILCTKESHCLGDILIKHYNKELEIKAVISNHNDLESLVKKFDIPYFYISHNIANQEELMIEKCKEFNASFIILAKYMRILSPKFVKEFNERIINIHHSFLPAFVGANPYKQAYDRGVKIIGATAHFVNDELDCGPIICQDTMQVDHTYSWKDMQKAGKNIERIVLAKAIELAIDDRIFIYKNKTIIF